MLATILPSQRMHVGRCHEASRQYPLQITNATSYVGFAWGSQNSARIAREMAL